MKRFISTEKDLDLSRTYDSQFALRFGLVKVEEWKLTMMDCMFTTTSIEEGFHETGTQRGQKHKCCIISERVIASGD